MIVHRFDAEIIPYQKQPFLSVVPQGEGEYPVEAGQKIDPELLVAVNDRFGVAFGAKDVPPRLQIFSQFLEVIDFPVEGDPYAPVFVGYGLVTRDEIDDA